MEGRENTCERERKRRESAAAGCSGYENFGSGRERKWICVRKEVKEESRGLEFGGTRESKEAESGVNYKKGG